MTPLNVVTRVFGPDDHGPLPCYFGVCPNGMPSLTRLTPCAAPEVHQPVLTTEEAA